MKTNNSDRYQVVVTEDYSGNTGDPFSREVSTFETLEEARKDYEAEKGETPDTIGCYRTVELADLGEDLNDYEVLESETTEGDIIPTEAVIVSYHHLTYMNYAYQITEVRKPNFNERLSDLNPPVDHTYKTWDLVVSNIDELYSDYEHGNGSPFDKLQKGSSIVEEFLGANGCEDYKEESDEE